MSTEQLQIIELPSHFIQVQLGGLKAIVDNHRQDNCRVQFDATEVERIDGAAVQFLISISQLQAQADKQDVVVVVVVNANEIITNALNDMGVANLIKTDGIANAQAEAA